MVVSSISSSLTSCNYPSLPLRNPRCSSLPHFNFRIFSPVVAHLNGSGRRIDFYSKRRSQICGERFLLRKRNFAGGESTEGPSGEEELAVPEVDNVGGDADDDWTTSVLLFVLWAALVFYVTQLAPDQTPSTDFYFLQKLLNLKGDDGFRMNQVLVALWYIMGLWPLVYSMLLLPSGRSSQSKVPVWPFLTASIFGGAYVLIPYFVLWKPPPPTVEEEETRRWPLNFLESKITAAVLAASGLGLIAYAGLASGEDWKEFFQYFRQSKFIHIMSLDFSLLSAFSAFWVFNDMSARKWLDRGSWLLPLTLIPFVGPAIYLLVRPPIPTASSSVPSSIADEED